MSEDRLLEELRLRALAIAYRMLESVAEAEDIVQEALVRVHRTLEDGERIESPRAFVATVATRLAIDELRSARARRESYVGEWLPEPLVVVATGDPRGPSRDGRFTLARIPRPAREPFILVGLHMLSESLSSRGRRVLSVGRTIRRAGHRYGEN